MKRIKCKSHKGHNATVHCPTCFKNFELKDLIKEAKKEVFDDMHSLIESLTTVDAQLQYQKFKIKRKDGKVFSSLTNALLEDFYKIKKQHLRK